jgi:hypothetical protein
MVCKSEVMMTMRLLILWLVVMMNNAAVQKFSQVYEDAQATLETNYFGTKTVTKELFPLLRSASPTIARNKLVPDPPSTLKNSKPGWLKGITTTLRPCYSSLRPFWTVSQLLKLPAVPLLIKASQMGLILVQRRLTL